MKINEAKLKQIINEEMMMLDDKEHMDHVDEEGGMAKSQLFKMAKYALMLHDALEDETQLEAWVQSKITIASEYLGKVKHYLEYEMGLEMHEPELEMESSEDYEDSMEEGGCGDTMEPQGQTAEPMMVMNGEDAYEIDDELAHLMET
jgi:hypothetical protein